MCLEIDAEELEPASADGLMAPDIGKTALYLKDN
jgi:hypothetical protein